MRYEAELFVALTRLDQGTAADISRISEIPRSRVYDVAQGLAEKGLVEISHARPLTYRAIPAEVALERLTREHQRNRQEALQSLQDVRKQRVERGHRGEFWIVNGLENVSSRAEEMMRGAQRSILVAVLLPQLLSPEMLELLRHKAQDGLVITMASARRQTLDRLQKAVPQATAILIPPYEGETGIPGRLVVVDQKELLLSALGEEELPGIPRETAVWSDAPGFASTVGLFVEMAAKALQQAGAC
jgi:sugar-specific transcriptional regulator TrmB